MNMAPGANAYRVRLLRANERIQQLEKQVATLEELRERLQKIETAYAAAIRAL